MNKWLGLVFGLAISGAGVAACTTTATEKYPTYDAMCTDVATQECQVATNCGTDAAKCGLQRKQACLTAAAAAITGGGRSYTAARAEDCVNKTKETYAKTPIAPTDLATLADTCNRVFVGTKSKGGTCASSYDCSGSLVCTQGHCGDKTDKKKGDGCNNPGDTCETGTFCGADSTGLKLCLAKIAVGNACDAVAAPCVETARCQEKVCKPRVGVGQSCDPTREADANADCAPEAPYCDAALGNVCAKGLFSLAGGAADCAAYGGSGAVVPPVDAGSGADSASPADAASGG